MRFGSVEFFKVLIKTVLAILFFAPLVAAVVFGVLFFKNGAELSDTKSRVEQIEGENSRLSAAIGVLVGEKMDSVEGFAEVFERSGVSYEELLAHINAKEDIDAEKLYALMSDMGISDVDIIAIAASKKTVGGEKFYEIMTKNGITDKDLITVIAKKNGGTIDEYYEILKECGLSDEDIVAYINKKNPPQSSSASSSESSSSSSSSSTETDSSTQTDTPSESTSSDEPVTSEPQNPYAALYEDMYVSEPVEYVRETNTVYMTFDDGPSKNTYSILKYLRDFDVKATFFVVPDRSEECAAALRAIAADGHAIGIHSASHDYNKIYASVEAFLDDFYEAWDIVREVTGKATPIFRFPGGSKNDFNEETRDEIIAEMTRRGFRFYDWNVESGDVDGATWTDMYNSIPKDIKGNYRSFVLMHDSSGTPNTVLVLEDVLRVLKNEGYKFDKINDDTKPYQYVGPFA